MNENVAALILTEGKLRWDRYYQEKSLLQHAIERVELLTNEIYVSCANPSVLSSIKQTVSPEILDKIKPILHDTSYPTLKGNLLGIVTGLDQIKTDILVVHGIDFPCVTSMDIMRLYRVLLDNPIEVMTYKTPNGHFTSGVMVLDSRLTKKRVDDLIDLDDTRISAFYRSSYNTGFISILSENHRMRSHQQNDDLCSDFDDDQTEFDEIEITRPEKYYLAYQKLKKRSVIGKNRLLELLLKELDMWDSSSWIQADIRADIDHLKN